jgi:hypothetical protein
MVRCAKLGISAIAWTNNDLRQLGETSIATWPAAPALEYARIGHRTLTAALERAGYAIEQSAG